jgi:hypothetical protein
MPIETSKEAFRVMCRVLGLDDIIEIISVSDATIEARCGDSAELAALLIKLKQETQRQSIAVLTGSTGSAGVHGGHAGGSLERQTLLLRMQNMR